MDGNLKWYEKVLKKVIKRLPVNRFTRFIVGVLQDILHGIKWVKMYRVKEVKVRVDYVYSREGKYIDTVSGHVREKNKVHLFSGIGWEDVDGIINILDSDDKPIDFEINFSGGWKQNIMLSPTLRKMMSKGLMELKEEHKGEKVYG